MRGRGGGGRGGGPGERRTRREQQQEGRGDLPVELEGGTTTGTEDDGSVASEQLWEDRNQDERMLKEERKKEKEEGVKATIPVDIMWQVMPVAIKERLTTRQLIMIISSILIRCNVPFDKFYLSLKTAQKYKKTTVEKLGSEALDTLAEEAKRGD